MEGNRTGFIMAQAEGADAAALCDKVFSDLPEALASSAFGKVTMRGAEVPGSMARSGKLHTRSWYCTNGRCR